MKSLILLFTTLALGISSLVQAQELKQANCHRNNFGMIEKLVEIDPTANGLNVTLHNPGLEDAFNSVTQEIATRVGSDPYAVASIQLQFSNEQCRQLADTHWAITCISDLHPLPRATTVKAIVTLAGNRVREIDLYTRLVFTKVTREIAGSYGPSTTTETSMSLYKVPTPGEIGTIVAAWDDDAAHFACGNGPAPKSDVFFGLDPDENKPTFWVPENL